jgi:DNA replication and repair protein RecF
MVIQKLSLLNFKNHREKSFEFSPQINCFVGNNGAGKTNVLDGLHYLSVAKSFLGNTDLNNIRTSPPNSVSEDIFTVEGQIFDGEKENIIKVQMPKDAKKIIKKNDKPYDRLADHIGFLPSVIISPYDSNLISDSGESRRRFLDAMISQTDSEYLFNLIQYQKTVQQRNALLKSF